MRGIWINIFTHMILMRSVWINVLASFANISIGVWNLSRLGSESWIVTISTVPINFFVAGYCALGAYRCYHQRTIHPRPMLRPCDHGVNWQRDGF